MCHKTFSKPAVLTPKNPIDHNLYGSFSPHLNRRVCSFLYAEFITFSFNCIIFLIRVSYILCYFILFADIALPSGVFLADYGRCGVDGICGVREMTLAGGTLSCVSKSAVIKGDSVDLMDVEEY